MKCIFALLVLILASISSPAQQTESKKSEDVDCLKEFAFLSRGFWNCIDVKNKAQAQEAKDSKAKLDAEALEAADKLKQADDELRQATEAWNNLHSSNTDQQIKGVTDAGKDVNSHVNNNPASKEVTDRAISVIERFAQMDNELLNSAGNAIQSGLATQAGSASPYSAGGQHQVHEGTKTNVESQPLTIEQRYQQQDQMLMSAPAVRSAVAAAEPTKGAVASRLSVEERYNNQENKILMSPRAVNAVTEADNAIQAAEQVRLANEAMKEAAHRAEIVARDREIAEAKVRDAKAKSDALDKELRDLYRQERWEAAREARERQALLDAMFGQRTQVASPYYSSPSGFYPGQYFPSAASLPSAAGGYQFAPQNSYSYGDADPYIHVDLPASNSKHTWGTFNPWHCMDNLSTEAACIKTDEAAAGIVHDEKPMSILDAFDAHQGVGPSATDGSNNSSGQVPAAQSSSAAQSPPPTGK